MSAPTPMLSGVNRRPDASTEGGARPQRTATSAFGAGRREGHDASEFYRGFFLGGHAPGPGPWFIYGLQDDAVYVNDSYLQDLDTSAWHEYTVITEGFYPDSQSTLLIDGEVAVILTGDSPNGITNAFAFGDIGRHANARVEITEVEITTFDGAPVAIEQMSLSAIKTLFVE
jgi:hypothetical protein